MVIPHLTEFLIERLGILERHFSLRINRSSSHFLLTDFYRLQQFESKAGQAWWSKARGYQYQPGCIVFKDCEVRPCKFENQFTTLNV